jgi:DNA polymerase
MNKDKLSPADILNWYKSMDIEEVIETDFNKLAKDNSALRDRLLGRNSSSGNASRDNSDGNITSSRETSNTDSKQQGSNPQTSSNKTEQDLSPQGSEITSHPYDEAGAGNTRAQVTSALNPQSLAPTEAIAEARRVADNCNSASELYQAVLNFEHCPLKKSATNTVFSDGAIGSEVMLIGEAPGANEDKQGIPFCGESGQLLDNIFKAIKLKRQKNLYISNTIFWRPPGNRVPTNEEIEMCRPFLERHIYLAAPKLLVMVGSTSAMSLLGRKLKITQARQQLFYYTNPYLREDIPSTAIFHPAYLLRQPQKKKSVWEDLLKIQELLASLSTN